MARKVRSSSGMAEKLTTTRNKTVEETTDHKGQRPGGRRIMFYVPPLPREARCLAALEAERPERVQQSTSHHDPSKPTALETMRHPRTRWVCMHRADMSPWRAMASSLYGHINIPASQRYSKPDTGNSTAPRQPSRGSWRIRDQPVVTSRFAIQALATPISLDC